MSKVTLSGAKLARFLAHHNRLARALRRANVKIRVAVVTVRHPRIKRDPALAKARAMLAFAREFSGPYVFGGEHDATLSDDHPNGNFDCSSSTSFLLAHEGLMPTPYAQVSGWFENYGQPGRGKYVTIHASSDHVWTEFTLPEGWFRFDTSPWGDGPNGPRVRTGKRSEAGFVSRHPKGL